MRKITYKDCPICGKEFQSLGYASHRAMHRRERERAKKLQQPPVMGSYLTDAEASKMVECCACGHKHKKGDRFEKKQTEYMHVYVCPQCGDESYYDYP